MALAFLLTILAGFSTTVGGVIGTHSSLLKCRSLALALGFSAGAMVYVSFVDLLPEGQKSLAASFGESAVWISSFAFLLGLVAVALIDKIVPHKLDICEAEDVLDGKHKAGIRKNKRLLRSGMIVAIALALHNFPEGIATLTGALHDTALGISLAIAIALHNIPEGVAVAAPIFAATKNRAKAIAYATASGLAEPIGALCGFVLVAWLLPESLLGIIFSAVAGMMVYISVSELLPTAKDYETGRQQSISGFMAGTAVMLVSLNLLEIG